MPRHPQPIRHLSRCPRIPRPLRLLRGITLLAALGLGGLSVGLGGTPLATPAASREGIAIIEVNRASIAQLDGLKGIGPALSRRILDAREASGPFQDWADLRHRVKGLGAHTAAQLSRQGLRVNGAGFDDPSSPPSPLPHTPLHQGSGAAGATSSSTQH